jgi:hypothetical protein
MKCLLARIAFALLAGLALAGPSRAGLVDWTYSVTPTGPNPVVSDGVSPTSSILLSGEGTVSATGSSGIVLAGLTASSTASPSALDTFTSKGWSTSLTITDTPSGLSNTVVISGAFTGTMSSGSSIISNVFSTSPVTFTLGGDTYTVTPDSFVGPSVPNATNSGGIGATVTVSSVGTASTTPEPSSLLLCGLGATGCALAGWRKRSRRAVLAA